MQISVGKQCQIATSFPLGKIHVNKLRKWVKTHAFPALSNIPSQQVSGELAACPLCRSK